MATKPDGKWKCRACGTVWEGWQLVLDPQRLGTTWTCANYFCGAYCDRLPDPAPEQPQEEGQQ
jgi:hypothetical protein